MIWIDDYPIDLATSEAYSFESEVTSFPVEKGADTTDHVRTGPIVITLECVVSNTPIGPVADDASRQALDFDRDLALPDAEKPIPADDCFQRMVAIWKARKPVTVDTSRGRFENMVLSLSVPVSIEESGGLRFTATLKQITLVENRRITIKQAAVPRGVGKINKGAIAGLDKIGGMKSVLVFTIRPGEKVNPAYWWATDPNKTLIFTSARGQHFRAEQGALADGWVDATGYHAFKTPIPTTIEIVEVTADGTPIPQTTDYVSPLDQRIGPKPVESWQDAWTVGFTKGRFAQ